jgi:hypothetical protein
MRSTTGRRQVLTGLHSAAFGEWPRGVSTFISDVARVASANPERSGCCHGQEQAQGGISAVVWDRLGMISLRGAAQARVAALLAITGQPGTDPGDFRRGTRGTQDEWDRARDDAFVPRAD